MQDELIKLVAGRRGHFCMESGFHSEWWFRLDALFDELERLRPFVAGLARQLSVHDIEAVCGPMTGGARLAVMVATELGVPSCIAERFEPAEPTGLFPIRFQVPAAQRELVRGKSVAIVDDAVSAGSAARGTRSDLLACGARPVALGALFIFGESAAHFATENGLALVGIARLPFALWSPGDCPLCRGGVPLEVVADTA